MVNNNNFECLLLIGLCRKFRNIRRKITLRSINDAIFSHPNARIEDYLGFYQLRNYGFINDVPLTDQIFVHSKIMIGKTNFNLF